MAESEMVERVARALADGGHLGVTLAFSEARPTDSGTATALRKHDTERAIAAARAALEAMREPTGAMISAIISECENQRIAFDEFSPPMYPGELYRQAISAALGQEGTEG